MVDHGRRRWVLAGVSIVSFLGCLDLTIVNTAAPAIGRSLGLGVTGLQVVVNVVVVALSMFMVVAGRLGDLFGRRAALLTGTVLFGVASLGAGFAPSGPWLVGWRFLQGAACAFLYTSSSAIVSAAFPPERRGRAIGTLFAVNGFGLAAGPLLGGVIVGLLGWPWIFWVNVPLVLLALAICVPTVAAPDAPAGGTRIDWPGLGLLVVGVSGVLFALTFHDAFGATSWPIVGSLAVGVVALVGFVLVELRVPDPLVPLRLLARRLFLAAVVSEFSLAFFYTTALFLTPLYLGLVRGMDEITVGLWMLPTTATVALLSPWVGRLVDRVGPVTVLAGGFAAFTVSAVLQAGLDAASGPVTTAVALVAMGVGWACVLGPSAVTALSAVPERLAGLAVGAGWTFHNLGGAVGLALGLTLYRAVAGGSVVDVSPDAVTAGHRVATLMLVASSVVALVAVVALGRRATVADDEPGVPEPVSR